MKTSKEMRELEQMAEELGVTRVELMENAGKAVAQEIEDKFGEELKNKKIIVVCGPGNNGGDGFVAARFLSDVSKVHVLFLGEKDNLPDEAKLNLECLEDIEESIGELILRSEQSYAQHARMEEYDIIIDAMLGTGTKGELRYPYGEIVRDINASKAFKLAVDIPTGIDPDTGKFHDIYVEPNLIVTFHDLKPGIVQFKDKVKIADIGIPC